MNMDTYIDDNTLISLLDDLEERGLCGTMQDPNNLGEGGLCGTMLEAINSSPLQNRETALENLSNVENINTYGNVGSDETLDTNVNPQAAISCSTVIHQRANASIAHSTAATTSKVVPTVSTPVLISATNNETSQQNPFLVDLHGSTEDNLYSNHIPDDELNAILYPKQIPGGFYNLSGRRVPKEVQILLSFGPKYSPVRIPNVTDYYVALENYNEIFLDQCVDLSRYSPSEMQLHYQRFMEIMSEQHNPSKIQQVLLQLHTYTSEYIKKQKDLLIVQADKGKTTCLVKRGDYIAKMNEWIDKNIEMGSYVLYAGNQDILIRRLTAVYRKQVRPLCVWYQRNPNSFPLSIYKNLQKMLQNSTPTLPYLYGTIKLHKTNQPLRPICSPLNWYIHPLHQLVQYVLKTALSTRLSSHNLHNMGHLTKHILELTPIPGYVFISLDIRDMYPSTSVTSLMRTLRNIMNLTWFKDSCPIPIPILIQSLEYILTEGNYFTFNNVCYEQVEGLPQGGAASGLLATVYLDSKLEIHNRALFHRHKVHAWWKYVDDVLIYISRHDILSFIENFQELVGYEVTYIMEAENILYNNYPCLAYLDYNIIHTPSSYQISLYQKEQQSLRMLHYTSHITDQVKRTTLLYYLRRVIYRTSLEYFEKDLADCISMILINGYPFTMVQNAIRHITLTYMHQRSAYIQMPTIARLMILKKYVQISTYPGLHDIHPRPRRYRRSIVFSCNEISQVFTQTTNALQTDIQPFSHSDTLYMSLNMSLRNITPSSTISVRDHILMVSCQVCGMGFFCTGKGIPSEIVEDIQRDVSSPIYTHMLDYQHQGLTRYVDLPLHSDMQLYEQLYLYQQIYKSMGVEWNSSQNYNIIPRFLVHGLRTYLEKIPTVLPMAHQKQHKRKVNTNRK